MKKILITMTLLILSAMPCFADADLMNTMFDAVQSINYGVSPTAVLRDSAYDYAQQQIDNAQQTQNQNYNYQTPQYQTNTQYPQQVNPYQNVNADTSTNQYSAPVQNPYVQSTQAPSGNFAITPFGNFTFYDGLMDVINKLYAMNGVIEIYLKYDGYPHPSTGNLKKLPKEKLATTINAYLMRESANTENISFIGKDGKTHYYKGGYVEIIAKKVWIEDIPFDFTMRLFANAGMVIHAPNKVIRDSKGFYYPLCVRIISLNTEAPNKISNLQKLNQDLKNKFAILINNWSDADRQNMMDYKWNVCDKYLNNFSFGYDAERGSGSLLYTSEQYGKYLNEVYQENLRRLDSQKYKQGSNSKI